MPGSQPPESLFVRLYFDRHIRARLAVDLRGHGYDVRTTEEAVLDTASDDEQLAFATAEGRAILTYNIRDFAPLHDECVAAGRPHAGIIVSRQLGRRQYGLLLERMLRLLNRFTAAEMVGNFVHLEQFKSAEPRIEEA
jgi:predicted nuclease of predicted toxin-antitoxin system